MFQEQEKHCGDDCKGTCQKNPPQTSLQAVNEEINIVEKAITKNKAIEIKSSAIAQNTKKFVFKIEGMCCATEVEHLKGALNPLIDETTTLTFDLINAKLILEGNNANFPSKDEIMKAVERTGMKATLWNDHVLQTHEQKTFWRKNEHTIIHMASLISLVIGFILHATRDGINTAFGGFQGGEETERPDDPPIATMAFYVAAIVAGSWFIAPKAIRAVRRLRPDINLLMVSATVGAVGINHWFEAASSMYLFSAAELLESWNMVRARRAIRVLMELAPSTAQVLNENGMITEQFVEQIPIGATITVRPGEKIPMDSMLIAGSTCVNQAPITGESMPVQKEVGDLLFAGTINGDSVIQCRVIKAASDSTLASIIRKVEEAQSRRARSDQFIEKFASYYVPSMIAASAVVSIIPPLATQASWYPWVYKGLELLVISCPCSLVISTPISIVAGLTAAAREGVLIKGGVYLETAAHIKAFAMDKTGTLTTGEPTVQNIIPLNGYNTEELLKLASALEIHSDHPLARAIKSKARAEGITSQPAEGFQIFKGKGAEGYINGELFWIGSHRFLHEKIGEHEPASVHEKIQALEAEGHSIVAIGHGQEICGLISIADTLRPESSDAIQALKRAGIERVVMLTGDNKGAAHAIAKSIGIDEYYAELLPENKVTQLESLIARYKRVAMVGDGINDAPAMAASSLGIAMGAAGSDAAIETADIALMSDDLRKLAWLVNHSHRTLNIIKQNVIFSLVVKSAFVGLTFANKSTLWMAMLSDMGTSFIVVSNGLRLLNNKTRVQAAPALETKPPMLYGFTKTQNSSSRTLPTVIEFATIPSKTTSQNTTNNPCKTNCGSDTCNKPSSSKQRVVPTISDEIITQQEPKPVLLAQYTNTKKACCNNEKCKQTNTTTQLAAVIPLFAGQQEIDPIARQMGSEQTQIGGCKNKSCGDACNQPSSSRQTVVPITSHGITTLQQEVAQAHSTNNQQQAEKPVLLTQYGSAKKACCNNEKCKQTATSSTEFKLTASK